ncbi:MAG: hypothetical protein WCS74_03095 [Dehalococcoidales bacterium]|jgi:hypothetical protein|nr:hypothetical protein [Dehalococcoidales bacterium]MDD3264622.1 hypothetical protein [Dehalococcoidales bacterium]MDD4322302.1 hypothetical protein [Dehalococcoidales bacterium]MDD4794144.1 hypothetical protein [Dehalococcoidales bacterium]MDD5122416.1 hypothetical protein [Dehalococcoidales bacterium]
MTQESDPKKLSESFSRIFTSFGEALSEIFNDPELKARAKEFGSSAAASASTFASRFKDKEVREKFAQAAFAAKEFGLGLVSEADDLLSRIKESDSPTPEDKNTTHDKPDKGSQD